jgi:hypothetical protein
MVESDSIMGIILFLAFDGRVTLTNGFVADLDSIVVFEITVFQNLQKNIIYLKGFFYEFQEIIIPEGGIKRTLELEIGLFPIMSVVSEMIHDTIVVRSQVQSRLHFI